jgi:hypothetical protein
MRIGFRGFVNDADIIITPPSRVTYNLFTSTRQVVTASRAIRLRRIADSNGKTLMLSWDSLPENELALLAFLASDEVHILYTDSGRALEVVFGEPTRNITRYLTWDGQVTYAVELPVFQVNMFTVSEVTSVSPPSERLLAIPTDLNTASHNWPPQQATPAYTPIHPSTSNGLPPGITFNSGNRFTFKVYALSNILRYYSVDGSQWFNAPGVTPLYKDWYSPVQNNRIAVGELQRNFFVLDNYGWSFGALLCRDISLADGTILRSVSDNNGLSVYHIGDVIYLTYQTANGLIYSWSRTLPSGYHYLYAQMNFGTLTVGFNTIEEVLTPSITSPSLLNNGTWIGGGGVFIDDLILVNNGWINMSAVRTWLLGGV